MMQIDTIQTDTLFEHAATLADLGYRLVQISCTRLPDGMELTYSFDKNYELINVRVNWTPGSAIPSIQAAYSCAFAYENEIVELFGVTITDMTIDFKGQLYTTAQPSPFGAGITIQEA